MSVVWYWVKISDELIENSTAEDWAQRTGLTLLGAAPYEPGDRLSRWWRVADPKAPAEFAGRKVELIFHWGDGPVTLERTLLDA